MKAGNLLIHGNGTIKLGDFGVSALMIEDGTRLMGRQTFVGTPCWMAPEVMEQVKGYDYKADIWSLGITAIELAKGKAPYAHYPPMKVLLLTIQNPPPTLDDSFSRSFRDFVDSCLQKDPNKRLTASKLLEHRFIKQAKSSNYIQTILMRNLPPLWERQVTPPPIVDDVYSLPSPIHSTTNSLTSNWNFSETDATSSSDFSLPEGGEYTTSNTTPTTTTTPTTNNNPNLSIPFGYSNTSLSDSLPNNLPSSGPVVPNPSSSSSLPLTSASSPSIPTPSGSYISGLSQTQPSGSHIKLQGPTSGNGSNPGSYIQGLSQNPSSGSGSAVAMLEAAARNEEAPVVEIKGRFIKTVIPKASNDPEEEKIKSNFNFDPFQLMVGFPPFFLVFF